MATDQNTSVVEFSLADLAGMDTSEIAIIASRLPMAGVWVVKCTEAKMGIQEGTEKNPQALPFIGYSYESLSIKPLKVPEGWDPDSGVGKKLSERATFWPKTFHDEIGLLKGKYKRVGLDTDGIIGGNPEAGQVGWVDGAVDKFWKIRVRHYMTGSGDERAGIDWLGPLDEIGEGEEAA